MTGIHIQISSSQKLRSLRTRQLRQRRSASWKKLKSITYGLRWYTGSPASQQCVLRDRSRLGRNVKRWPKKVLRYEGRTMDSLPFTKYLSHTSIASKTKANSFPFSTSFRTLHRRKIQFHLSS